MDAMLGAFAEALVKKNAAEATPPPAAGGGQQIVDPIAPDGRRECRNFRMRGECNYKGCRYVHVHPTTRMVLNPVGPGGQAAASTATVILDPRVAEANAKLAAAATGFEYVTTEVEVTKSKSLTERTREAVVNKIFDACKLAQSGKQGVQFTAMEKAHAISLLLMQCVETKKRLWRVGAIPADCYTAIEELLAYLNPEATTKDGKLGKGAIQVIKQIIEQCKTNGVTKVATEAEEKSEDAPAAEMEGDKIQELLSGMAKIVADSNKQILGVVTRQLEASEARSGGDKSAGGASVGRTPPPAAGSRLGAGLSGTRRSLFGDFTMGGSVEDDAVLAKEKALQLKESELKKAEEEAIQQQLEIQKREAAIIEKQRRQEMGKMEKDRMVI